MVAGKPLSITTILVLLPLCTTIPTSNQARDLVVDSEAPLPYAGRFFATIDFPKLDQHTIALIEAQATGIAALDAKCQAVADANNLGESWGAFVGDSAGCDNLPCRRASTVSNMGDGQVDWLLHPSSMYYHHDNKTAFANTTSTALLNFPLLSKLSACGNPSMGMDAQWRSTGHDCKDWTVTTGAATKSVGYSCQLTRGFLSGGNTGCEVFPSELICVSNPAKRSTQSLCGATGACHSDKCALPADNVTCDCRCGCQWNGPETVAHVDEKARFGATVVLGGHAVADELDEVAVEWNNPETAEYCNCIGDGTTPACNNQYAAPDTTNIQKFGQSALTSKDTIVFFGDSITWLGGYIDLLKEAAVAKNVTYSNRGINGGTVKDLRDGITRMGTVYPDFETVMKTDKPTMVNFMIGINDVWFSLSNVTEYTSILSDMVSRVKKAGVKVTVSTVSVIGENQGSSKEPALHQFAEAGRQVAKSLNVPLADVHQAYLDYEAKYNTLPEGGLYNGVLTIDGVHPCMGGFNSCPIHTHGNMLLADTIAGGLLEAMSD